MEEPTKRTISFLLTFLLVLLSRRFLLTHATPHNTSLSFQSSSLQTLNLLGDAYLHDGSVTLTRSSGVPSSSSGAVICNFPVQFRDPETNSSASFSSLFSFAVSSSGQLPPSGDSLSFFISQENQAPLSLSSFSLQFNTFSNTVCFNSGDNSSALTRDLSELGIDLKDSSAISAWFEFISEEKILSLRLSYSGEKPQRPALSGSFDLSAIFHDFMYVGFAASTEGSTELHTVLDWSFQTNFCSPPAAISPSGSHLSGKKLGIGFSVAIPAATLFFILLVFFLARPRKHGEAFSSEFVKGPKKISYRDLSSATGNFHRSKIIGEGSFGNVYRAMDSSSGTVYAVKRSVHPHGKSEFLSELTIIASLRHKNLVQLVGWCAEKEELLLVYEFMPNGSLDKLLHGTSASSSSSALNFSQRWKITRGIVSVLIYLHQECEQQVIHRDIKSSNILLDGEFNPRLGDFGLAKLMDHDKSPDCTLTAGTMGYLAPEYLQYGKATEKTDVFSFGVVVLEICCGRRPIDEELGKVNLVDWVWGLHADDRLQEAVDPRLGKEFNFEEMRRLLLVGLSCVNPDFRERPCMREVLRVLSFEVEPVQVPKRKPFPVFLYGVPTFSLLDIASDSETVPPAELALTIA